MKTITINVLKKNRIYFACEFENGCKCKLKITSESSDLTLGQHTLLVEDESVRTKYGTDLIYSMKQKVEENEEIITLQHYKYNFLLVDECKNLGGRWDSESKVWVFNSFVSDKVEELDEVYNSEMVNIEIEFKNSQFGAQESARFCGYVLAKATGRDSGAQLGEGVSLISGEIGSGGSMKNWGTCISVGSIMRMKVPKLLLEKHASRIENNTYIFESEKYGEKILSKTVKIID